MAKRKAKSEFWNIKLGFRNTGKHLIQAGKEVSTIAAYAGRELTGTPHKKPVCKLKKGWFE